MMRAKMFEGQLWVLAEDAQRAISNAVQQATPTPLGYTDYGQLGLMPDQQRRPTFSHGALFDPTIFAESQDGKPEQNGGLYP